MPPERQVAGRQEEVFFLKPKRSKKHYAFSSLRLPHSAPRAPLGAPILPSLSTRPPQTEAKWKKVFLVLFFQKKNRLPSCRLPYSPP
jgi:hypothetical protein